MSLNNNPFLLNTKSLGKCNISNCLECSTFNECKICKPDYINIDNKCFLKECSIFGKECNFCSEFDCLSCKKGYKISYGFCDKEEYLVYIEKLLGFILPFFIMCVLFIFVFIFRKNRKNAYKHKIVKAEIIKKKRPSTGQYIIYNYNINNNREEKKENINDEVNNQNTNLTENEQFINFEDIHSEFSIGSNNCVICGRKCIFSFSVCGCAICREHSVPQKGQTLICPNHNIPLNRKLYIKKSYTNLHIIPTDKSKYIQLCPICNVEPSIKSFNCGCSLKVCTKCFNENLYVFKIKKCPRCNHPYKEL